MCVHCAAVGGRLEAVAVALLLSPVTYAINDGGNRPGMKRALPDTQNNSNTFWAGKGVKTGLWLVCTSF